MSSRRQVCIMKRMQHIRMCCNTPECVASVTYIFMFGKPQQMLGYNQDMLKIMYVQIDT